MLNDPNPGVREAAIVCIEVSNIDPIATIGILLYMLIASQSSLIIIFISLLFYFSMQDDQDPLFEILWFKLMTMSWIISVAICCC